MKSTPDDIETQGREAYKRGTPFSANPHRYSREKNAGLHFQQWNHGWHRAEHEYLSRPENDDDH